MARRRPEGGQRFVIPAPPRAAFLSAYSGMLAKAEVRRLFAGSMIARLPTAMLPLAILLLVHSRSGSLAAAGLVVGAHAIGRAALSPAVGALIDRAGQVRVLIAGSAIQAVLLACLVAAAELRAPIVVTAGVAAAAGAASPPIQACLRALWPVLAAGQAEREAAYSFDATTQELLWIAGPLLVAAFLVVASPATVVIISAAIACGGVALYSSSPVVRAWQGVRHARQFRLGALADADVRTLLATCAFAGCSWGALTFGLTALAVGAGNSRASGLLLACVSAGSIAGGLLYGARSWRWPTIARYRGLLALCLAGCLPLLFARSVTAAAPLSVLAGLPLAPVYAAMYVLTGRLARPGTTTEAFTWTSSSFALGVSLGTAGAGVASQSVAIAAAFALACAAAAAAALLSLFVRDPEAE